MWRLRNYDISPPGGFIYQQVKGIPRLFDASPQIEFLAKTVAAFRQNNGLTGATIGEALRHIDRQMCARLGNDPRWCVEVPDDQANSVAANLLGSTSPLTNPPAPCPGCGAKVS